MVPGKSTRVFTRPRRRCSRYGRLVPHRGYRELDAKGQLLSAAAERNDRNAVRPERISGGVERCSTTGRSDRVGSRRAPRCRVDAERVRRCSGRAGAGRDIDLRRRCAGDTRLQDSEDPVGGIRPGASSPAPGTRKLNARAEAVLTGENQAGTAPSHAKRQAGFHSVRLVLDVRRRGRSRAIHYDR